MVGSFAGCCARAASGHAAAAPPSAASNSRRPMVTVMRPSRARVRKRNDITPRACCPNSAAAKAGGAHLGTLAPEKHLFLNARCERLLGTPHGQKALRLQ